MHESLKTHALGSHRSSSQKRRAFGGCLRHGYIRQNAQHLLRQTHGQSLLLGHQPQIKRHRNRPESYKRSDSRRTNARISRQVRQQLPRRQMRTFGQPQRQVPYNRHPKRQNHRQSYQRKLRRSHNRIRLHSQPSFKALRGKYTVWQESSPLQSKRLLQSRGQTCHQRRRNAQRTRTALQSSTTTEVSIPVARTTTGSPQWANATWTAKKNGLHSTSLATNP